VINILEKYIAIIRQDKNNLIYLTLLALALIALAIIIIAQGKTILTITITTILFLSSLTILTYIYNFLNLNPYYFGILFSFITTIITAIIYIVYSIKTNKSVSIGIAFILQLIIAKAILKLYFFVSKDNK